MINLKQTIKLLFLKLKLKLKSKKFILCVGNNSFISRKAKIIMEEGSELTLGENCYISDGVRIIVHKNSSVIIKNNVYVSINSIISSNSRVEIGDHTSIAHNVTIIDTNKNYEDCNKLIKEQGAKSFPIIIGRDCWIATGAVILQGVSIGNHCVIGANSVINKSFEENTVIAGVPGRIIKFL